MFQIKERLKKDEPIKIRYFKIKNKKVFPSRDFVDIRIIFLIFKKIIKDKKYQNIGTKIINVGSGISTPIIKIISNFEKLINKKIKVHYEEIDSKELMQTRANIKKLKTFLKSSVKFNLKKTLNTYLD
jgi:UDP-glucose 4-epimerase